MTTIEDRKKIKKVIQDAEKYLADARKHTTSGEQCLTYLQAAILRAQYAEEIILAGQNDT